MFTIVRLNYRIAVVPTAAVVCHQSEKSRAEQADVGGGPMLSLIMLEVLLPTLPTCGLSVQNPGTEEGLEDKQFQFFNQLLIMAGLKGTAEREVYKHMGPFHPDVSALHEAKLRLHFL